MLRTHLIDVAIFLCNMIFTWTGKSGKMGRHFPVRKICWGILNKLEILGKSQGTLHKILKNSGNFRKMLFVIFTDIYMNYVLFAKMDKVFS